MNVERFLAYYEQAADAPNAIARLRRFILNLAVRGKLVPQDPNDEPASELLKRIAAEKARLEDSGHVRRSKEVEAKSTENPFALANNWAWTSLQQLARARMGKTILSKELVDEGLPVFSAGMENRPWGYLKASDVIFSRGTIVISARGGIGYPKIPDFDEFVSTQTTIASECFNKEVVAYLCLVLEALPDWQGMKSQTAIPMITVKQVHGISVPLPPLAEQHRIVAKVDELMGLCDRLEAAGAGREAVRDRLVAASLAHLTAPDPETFQADARFVLDALPALTTRPDQIKALRQTILNLAVRGKLVSQDASDEPALELLKQLKKARTALEKKGEIRREKGSPSHYGSEQRFEVPSSWSWARLTEIGQTQTGTSPSSEKPDLFGRFIPFVKPADLDGNQINYDGPGLSEIGVAHSRLAAENSILMVCIGATLGKVNTTTRPVCFNQQINSLTPFLIDLTAFVSIALRASDFQSLAWSKAGTGTLPIISKGKWEVLPIPLPPLAEQHRIVAKVNALMALCDKLEASLTAAADTRRRLLDALLAEALAPDEGRLLEAAE